MPKPRSAERIARIERAIRELRAEVRNLRRDLDNRTRPANRIGFEVFREDDYSIEGLRQKNYCKHVWRK